MKPITQRQSNLILLAVLMLSIVFSAFAFYGGWTLIHNLIHTK